MPPAARTEVHHGVEFEVPVWDRKLDRWAKDEPVTNRCLMSITAALPDNIDELTREAMTATGDNTCATFWGSHGCALTNGHRGLHVCKDPTWGVCSAGLELGVPDGDGGGTLIVWFRYAGTDELTLSALHWRWSG